MRPYESSLQHLREALLSALDDAHAETEALQRFDTPSVQVLTLRREAFNLTSAPRLAKLQAELSGVERSVALEAELAELRALADRLTRRDQLNRTLAQQALRYTRAYLDALVPRSAAYDRRGLATRNAPALTTLSHRT